jgi:hypothetical protein
MTEVFRYRAWTFLRREDGWLDAFHRRVRLQVAVVRADRSADIADVARAWIESGRADKALVSALVAEMADEVHGRGGERLPDRQPGTSRHGSTRDRALGAVTVHVKSGRRARAHSGSTSRRRGREGSETVMRTRLTPEEVPVSICIASPAHAQDGTRRRRRGRPARCHRPPTYPRSGHPLYKCSEGRSRCQS